MRTCVPGPVSPKIDFFTLSLGYRELQPPVCSHIYIRFVKIATTSLRIFLTKRLKSLTFWSNTRSFTYPIFYTL